MQNKTLVVPSPHLSSRDKKKHWLLIHLRKGTKKGIWRVELSVPLDVSQSDERNVVTSFGRADGDIYFLDLGYDVKISFSDYTEDFTDYINEVYEDKTVKTNLMSLSRNALSEYDLLMILQPLAEWGARLFNILFVQIEPEFNKADVDMIRKALRSALNRPQHIVIRSSTQQIPWAFLFDGREVDWRNRSTIDPSKFWGFMHELEIRLPGTNGRLNIKEPPQFLCAICEVEDKEKWHKQPDHPFVRLNGAVISVNTVSDLKAALFNFTQDCFYFYGHAVQSKASGILKLSGAPLSAVMLQECRIIFANKNPVVVFLNGCSTLPISQWSAESMIGFLCERGENNLCCVGAVAGVPNTWAALFAEKLWDEFIFKGATIGEALKSARLYLWDEFQNPLGLLYAVFGRADTYIETSPVSHEAN